MRRLAVVLLMLLLAPGCAEPEAGPTSLGDLPGVRAAEVGQDDGADDPEGTDHAVVDLEPDATAAQAADVLRAIADLPRVGRSVVWLGAGHLDVGIDEDEPASLVLGTGDPDLSAERLLAGSRIDGTRTEVDPGRERVDVAVLDGEVPDVARAVLADDVLADAPVTVRGDQGALTPALVDTWDAITAAGADLTRLSVVEVPTIRIELSIDAPAGPEQRPDVVPALRAALDAQPSTELVLGSSGQQILLSLLAGPDGYVVAVDERGWLASLG